MLVGSKLEVDFEQVAITEQELVAHLVEEQLLEPSLCSMLGISNSFSFYLRI
jgi:hypothetical protein